MYTMCHTIPFPDTLFIVTKFDPLDSMHSPVNTPHANPVTYEQSGLLISFRILELTKMTVIPSYDS